MIIPPPPKLGHKHDELRGSSMPRRQRDDAVSIVNIGVDQGIDGTILNLFLRAFFQLSNVHVGGWERITHMMVIAAASANSPSTDTITALVDVGALAITIPIITVTSLVSTGWEVSHAARHGGMECAATRVAVAVVWSDGPIDGESCTHPM